MKTLDAKTLEILRQLKDGEIQLEQVIDFLLLSGDAHDDIEMPDAVLDMGREERTGFPEAIFAAGKTPQQVCGIFSRMLESSGKALATRCSAESLALLVEKIPEVSIAEACGLAWVKSEIVVNPGISIAVIAAGTSDLAVAEEAALTLEFAGYQPQRIYDVGVAGIHRLLDRVVRFAGADVVIVVAGMEGALPSVVGGLVSCPVIAVPTSIGYGASFGGLAALLGMLNSCSAGITVVNIDNGFGAAVAAVRIVKGKR